MSLSSLGLDAFYAIAKHGTVIEAAKQIRLTQTAVTQRIRALENEVGATLFIRTKKGMKLTADGLSLFQYCLQRTDLESKAIAQIQKLSLGHQVQLVVSGPTYLLEDRVVPTLDKIKKDFPHLTIHLDVNHSQDLLTRVIRGEIDLAIIPSTRAGIDVQSKRLTSTKYVIVGPIGWEGRDLANILQEEKEVVYSSEDRFIDHFFRETGRDQLERKGERIFINSEFLVAQAVVKGAGYMMLDTRHADPLIQKKKLLNLLPGHSTEMSWDLVWAKRTVLSSYLQGIIAAVK